MRNALVHAALRKPFGRRLFLLAMVVLVAGCRSVSLPPIDLAAPGWTVLQGQALRKPRAGLPELAGELLIATNAHGQSVVHFTKTPFPLVVAQRSGATWKIEFPPENKTYSGRGKGPSRLLWIHLVAALDAGVPPAGWTMARHNYSHHTFKHRSGETLEVVLDLPRPAIYRLKKGDTLHWLAHWFDVSVADLIKANRHLDLTRLQPGDPISIPQ